MSVEPVATRKPYYVVVCFVTAAIMFFVLSLANAESYLGARFQSAAFMALIAAVLSSVWIYLVFGLKDSVDSDPGTLKVVASCADPIEAQAVIQSLGAAGIEAKPMGLYTSSFQVEAPGDVKVVVRQDDLAQAKKVVENLSFEAKPAT